MARIPPQIPGHFQTRHPPDPENSQQLTLNSLNSPSHALYSMPSYRLFPNATTHLQTPMPIPSSTNHQIQASQSGLVLDPSSVSRRHNTMPKRKLDETSTLPIFSGSDPVRPRKMISPHIPDQSDTPLRGLDKGRIFQGNASQNLQNRTNIRLGHTVSSTGRSGDSSRGCDSGDTFACPFFKHSPDRFAPGTKSWLSCARRGWVISRLKQVFHAILWLPLTFPLPQALSTRTLFRISGWDRQYFPICVCYHFTVSHLSLFSQPREGTDSIAS